MVTGLIAAGNLRHVESCNLWPVNVENNYHIEIKSGEVGTGDERSFHHSGMVLTEVDGYPISNGVVEVQLRQLDS